MNCEFLAEVPDCEVYLVRFFVNLFDPTTNMSIGAQMVELRHAKAVALPNVSASGSVVAASSRQLPGM